MTNRNDPHSYSPIVADPVEGRCVPTEYLHLPEAQGLVWEDNFFDEEDGVIAVFDFDYEKMKYFLTRSTAVSQVGLVIFMALFVGMELLAASVTASLIAMGSVLGFYLLSLQPCFVSRQMKWVAEANHLAITRDGIRYVQDRRKGCWGWSICDQGKNSKTVPFDQITDCDITEPAGNMCLCIPRILYQVNVDTASSGGKNGIQHELILVGLKDPIKFKAMVWAMKREWSGRGIANASWTPESREAPVQVEMSERGSLMNKQGEGFVPNNSGGASDVALMLREIRDELRQNNELLRKIHSNDGSVDPRQMAPPSMLADTLTAVITPASQEEADEIDLTHDLV